MLAVANAKYPEVATEKTGLQELAFPAEFDAAICVDAMENVFPEEWPLVLSNLRRAVRPGGHVYMTVETIDEREITEVFEVGLERAGSTGRLRRSIAIAVAATTITRRSRK